MLVICWLDLVSHSWKTLFYYFNIADTETVRLCITFLFTNIAVPVFTLSKSTIYIWLTIFHLFNMVKRFLWEATTSTKLCLFNSKCLTFLPPVHVIYVDWQHQYLRLPCHHLLQGVHLTRLSKNTKKSEMLFVILIRN